MAESTRDGAASFIAAVSAAEPNLLDCRGHRCPTPSLRLRKTMERIEPGDAVRLLADDPMARIDVPHLAAQQGWTVEAIDEMTGDRGRWLDILVRKPAGQPR